MTSRFMVTSRAVVRLVWAVSFTMLPVRILLSQDCIDLLRGKATAEAVGRTPRHQFFINASTAEAVEAAKEPEGWRRRRN